VVADFGGTNARFAVVGEAPHQLERVQSYRCSDFSSLEQAVRAYLAEQKLDRLEAICIAVAAPVDQELIDLPNNHWMFSKPQLEASLGAPLQVINDFTAQALALDLLEPGDIEWFGPLRPVEGGVRTMIGPGTGLGVAVRTPGGEIVPSEGGHIGFAPSSEHEIDLLRHLFSRYRRVSIERLVSGPGLENIYWANRRIEQPDSEPERARHTSAEIADLAHQGDARALRSIEDFFDILAGFAGDMALATWATGGIYLSGGVFRKLRRFLDPERFRARFEDKGRFTRFCEEVAVGWVRREQMGLLGCSAALAGAGVGVPARPQPGGPAIVGPRESS
jgi:glucokinase